MEDALASASHQEAVDLVCRLLLTTLGQEAEDGDEKRALMWFGQGLMTAIGCLALDPVPGSVIDVDAVAVHGREVFEQWVGREEQGPQ